MNLRKDTAQAVTIGPILDGDGQLKTNETVANIKVSKNGGAYAALNASATLTSTNDGCYDLALTAIDVNTLGTLQLKLVDLPNTMPVVRCNVATQAAWDALYAASGGYVLAKNDAGNTIATETTAEARATPSDVANALTAYGSAKPPDITAAVSGLATQTSVDDLPTNSELAAALASIEVPAPDLTGIATSDEVAEVKAVVDASKTELDGIAARSQIITTGPQTALKTGIALIRGDTYDETTRPIIIPAVGQPNLTGATLKLTVRSALDDSILLEADGTATVAGEGIEQSMQFTTIDGDTDALIAGAHPFDVEAVWTTGEGEEEIEHRWTVAFGPATVTEDQTRREVTE